MPTNFKRGRCIIKKPTTKLSTNNKTGETVEVQRGEWIVDNEIPIFSSNPEYVNRFVFESDDVGEAE